MSFVKWCHKRMICFILMMHNSFLPLFVCIRFCIKAQLDVFLLTLANFLIVALIVALYLKMKVYIDFVRFPHLAHIVVLQSLFIFIKQ